MFLLATRGSVYHTHNFCQHFVPAFTFFFICLCVCILSLAFWGKYVWIPSAADALQSSCRAHSGTVWPFLGKFGLVYMSTNRTCAVTFTEIYIYIYQNHLEQQTSLQQFLFFLQCPSGTKQNLKISNVILLWGLAPFWNFIVNFFLFTFYTGIACVDAARCTCSRTLK